MGYLGGDGDSKQDDGKNPGNSQDSQPMPFRGLLIWLLLFAAILTAFHFWAKNYPGYEEIFYYPDFVEYVKDGRVTKCEIISEVSSARRHILCDLKPTTETTGEARRIRVNVAAGDEVEKLLDEYSVRRKNVHPSPVVQEIVLGVLPVILLFGVLYFVFIRQIRSAGRGVMGFGRSRAKMLQRERHKITFKNVAGIDEAKDEVLEIIMFLKDPKRFQKLGGRIPKGVLLMGQPGTGKTLLARAIAGEAEVPFFSISGSDFVEMFVGVGASRVRDMFEQGKRSAPCLIFIDEIDAVGRSRFTGIGGGHDEREQTLNALLVEMDGFESTEGVIIIAATNRPDVLDPALLRPGRFDRQIVIDLPMIEGREAILKMHAKKLKLATKVDLRRLARGTPGFSGADLENLLNEAALLGAKAGKEAVEQSDLEEARDKVKWGRERRSHAVDEKEKKNTAIHEAGHALVQYLIPECEPLHKVTIIPRGMYLGATMTLPEKDKLSHTKAELLGELCVLMAGRIAEGMMLASISTGARGDFKTATRVARAMVCDWGMSENLGPQTFGENEELMFLGREVSRSQNYSEDTARKIDAEVSAILRSCYERATTVLSDNREKLEMLAERLLQLETVDGCDVADIVEYGRIRSETEREEAERLKKAEGSDNEPPPVPGPGAGETGSEVAAETPGSDSAGETGSSDAS